MYFLRLTVRWQSGLAAPGHSLSVRLSFSPRDLTDANSRKQICSALNADRFLSFLPFFFNPAGKRPFCMAKRRACLTDSMAGRGRSARATYIPRNLSRELALCFTHAHAKSGQFRGDATAANGLLGNSNDVGPAVTKVEQLIPFPSFSKSRLNGMTIRVFGDGRGSKGEDRRYVHVLLCT